MVKPITIDSQTLTIGGKEANGIVSFSQKDLSQMIQSGIVDVYKDDIYVAQMPSQDYEEYNETFDTCVEDVAYEMYKTQKDELLKKYPESTIQSIIGFVLSKELYDRP